MVVLCEYIGSILRYILKTAASVHTVLYIDTIRLMKIAALEVQIPTEARKSEILSVGLKIKPLTER